METPKPRKYPAKKKEITVTEEFLEAVDEYILAATNENRFYQKVKEWFAPSYNRELTSGFPVVNGIADLNCLMNKIKNSNFGMNETSTEKRAFVQTMLYLHYIGEFVSEYADMRITDFYDIKRKVDPVWKEQIASEDKQPEAPVHPYLDDKMFLPETVDFANEYVAFLVRTNADNFYKGSHACGTFKLDPSLACTFYDSKKQYDRTQRQVDLEDRQKFALLCRLVIWNHYADLFGLVKTVIPVKESNLTEEIDQHLANAEQHLKIVENKMNTLTKFEKQVSATVHLIHGRPAEDYTESELMQLIREAQKNKAAISDLVETSERMKAKSAQYDADIAVYVTALDKLQ